MKATTIKYYFSSILLITAIMMSAYSCAGVPSYENKNKHQLFALQIESEFPVKGQEQHLDSSLQDCTQN